MRYLQECQYFWQVMFFGTSLKKDALENGALFSSFSSYKFKHTVNLVCLLIEVPLVPYNF